MNYLMAVPVVSPCPCPDLGNVSLGRFLAGAYLEYEPMEGRGWLVRIQMLAPCNKNPDAPWSEQPGRWWFVSKEATTCTLHRTIYAAAKAYILHELAETFLVDGKAPFEHTHEEP